jgi:hypothetical protein
MDKADFVKTLKDFKKEISGLANRCRDITSSRVRSRAIWDALESLATRWFEQIEPILRSTFRLDDEVLQRYREPFGKILELSGGEPSKRVVQTILDSILRSYHVDVLVPVQKYQAVLSKFPSLDTVLSNAVGLEVDYLTEAIECARLGKRRAAVILGWCAAVDRLHLCVEKEGFAKFNSASVQMSAITSGRYKRFNKRFDIQNLSDLRMTVFDGDLLWILEFMGMIDGNQHERLGICLTMRDTCAHPGEAIVSDENIPSFFSDIDSLVFANAKFAL